MGSHHPPRRQRNIPVVIGVGLALLLVALVLVVVPQGAPLHSEPSAPPAAVTTTPAAASTPTMDADAPAAQRQAFVDILTRDGMPLTGHQDQAIDLAQLAAESKAGDGQLKQVVHTLLPQLSDTQDAEFVDAMHRAFPDAG